MKPTNSDPAILEKAQRPLNLYEKGLDRAFPAIRFFYERVMGHVWFSQITPQLWLGGAPLYKRDYDQLVSLGIGAVINIRAEREDEIAYYDQHNIAHIQYKIPEVEAPDLETIAAAVAWMDAQIEDNRPVLVHCAKGRSRSAALVAAYLMWKRGMSYEEAKEYLESKRNLTKLDSRHAGVLKAWEASQRNS